MYNFHEEIKNFIFFWSKILLNTEHTETTNFKLYFIHLKIAKRAILYKLILKQLIYMPVK
ncbi:hypothetical protein NIES3974_26490 [Calothrix sp. NIES-3974]|nr:hypothetical protein NIES3974_26490 [Calothrix sp. NIES-3974]